MFTPSTAEDEWKITGMGQTDAAGVERAAPVSSKRLQEYNAARPEARNVPALHGSSSESDICKGKSKGTESRLVGWQRKAGSVAESQLRSLLLSDPWKERQHDRPHRMVRAKEQKRVRRRRKER